MTSVGPSAYWVRLLASGPEKKKKKKKKKNFFPLGIQTLAHPYCRVYEMAPKQLVCVFFVGSAWGYGRLGDSRGW